MKQITCFGEIVFDLFPRETRLGGAPLNVAYHLNQLQLPVLFYSAVGQDEFGELALKALHNFQLPHQVVQNADLPTGSVVVDQAPDGSHRFIIVENCAWEKIPLPPTESEMVLFGSLAMKSARNRENFNHFLEEQPTWKLCDLNIRQPFFDQSTADWCLTQANALKINDEELALLKSFYKLSGNVEQQVRALSQRFDLSAVALTMGSEGAYLLLQEEWHFHPAHKVESLIDTVGAGDSFTSIFAAGLVQEKSSHWILSHGTQLAAKICGLRGAFSEEKSFYSFISS